jgi:hypothetical protein
LGKWKRRTRADTDTDSDSDTDTDSDSDSDSLNYKERVVISESVKEMVAILLVLFDMYPIYLYREAMHLQYFPPTRYVMGGATRAHIRDDLYQIC